MEAATVDWTASRTCRDQLRPRCRAIIAGRVARRPWIVKTNKPGLHLSPSKPLQSQQRSRIHVHPHTKTTSNIGEEKGTTS